MNENQGGANNLLDTTDCLEAVGVFKGWKNLSFVIIVIGIVLIQLCFWLVDMGLISVPSDVDMAISGESTIMLFPVTAEVEPETVADVNEEVEEAVPEPNLPAELESPADSNQPAEANEPMTTAEEEPAEPNQPEETATEIAVTEPPQVLETQAKDEFLFGITFDHLVWVMRFVNAILILVGTLYCLTLLFSLKVSMLGRLGGINHITRAFFLSLLALILLLPWQKVFDCVAMGAMFSSDEMLEWFTAKTDDMLDIILYYLRFCGYWLLVLLLLILAQIRSSRWAGAILRRLEVI